MAQNGLVDRIAKLLNIKATQLKVADVHAKIPKLKRMVEEYEKQATDVEAAASECRRKAFSPDTPPTERAKLLNQSVVELKRAKTLAGFAGTFLTQLGHFSALETTMQVAGEMKEVGLIGSDVSIMDWQNAMDTMQDEIQRIVATSQKLGDVMGSVLAQEAASTDEEAVDELNQLFAKWEAEPDPVQKAQIQKLIEAKSNAALV